MLNRDELTLVTAKRLKALREEKGLSHKNLSDELRAKYNISISKSSLINYEAEDYHSKSGANSGMRIDYLRCLADYYGVTTDYLLGLDDCPSIDPDVQAISKYLGLSVKGIDALRESLYESTVLNQLCEIDEFWDLIAKISSVRANVDRLLFNIQVSKFDWLRDPQNAKVSYLEAVESLTALIDVVCNYHKTMEIVMQRKEKHLQSISLAENDMARMTEDDFVDWLQRCNKSDK